MATPIRILLQTTIPITEDDWSIERYSLLRDYLASLKDADGNSLFEVTARNREADADENDPVLSTLAHSNFDELWLFAADIGDSLTSKECSSILGFRQRGGGVLITRDHQDLGSSIFSLGGIGTAHFFHSKNQDPDPERCCNDDTHTKSISWPNYHSGRNGDYQKITPTAPVHELLQSGARTIEFFPAHPHEGGVGVPADASNGRVIATGNSLVTGRAFNLAVAFERVDADGNMLGRAVAESSFHHFLDYNWNPDLGCPSFVEEVPGDGMKQPQALEDIKTYVRNLALWLAPAN